MRVRLPPTAKFFQVFSSILELSPPPFMKEYEEICEKYEGIWRDGWKIKKYGGNMKEIWKNATLYKYTWTVWLWKITGIRETWENSEPFSGERRANSQILGHFSISPTYFSYFPHISSYLLLISSFFFTYSPSLWGSSQLYKFWDTEKFQEKPGNKTPQTWNMIFIFWLNNRREIERLEFNFMNDAPFIHEFWSQMKPSITSYSRGWTNKYWKSNFLFQVKSQ